MKVRKTFPYLFIFIDMVFFFLIWHPTRLRYTDIFIVSVHVKRVPNPPFKNSKLFNISECVIKQTEEQVKSHTKQEFVVFYDSSV